MKPLFIILQDYRAYHTKKSTKMTHFIGVPLVIFGIMTFLGWFFIGLKPFVDISLLWLVTIAACVYYIRLDFQLGISITVCFLIMAAIASAITHNGFDKANFFIFLFCFIVGWIIQFVGHFFEKRKPALLDNLWQALSAPVFLAAEIAVMLGHRKDLKAVLY